MILLPNVFVTAFHQCWYQQCHLTALHFLAHSIWYAFKTRLVGFNALTYRMHIFIAVGNRYVDTSMSKFFLAEDYFIFYIKKFRNKMYDLYNFLVLLKWNFILFSLNLYVSQSIDLLVKIQSQVCWNFFFLMLHLKWMRCEDSDMCRSTCASSRICLGLCGEIYDNSHHNLSFLVTEHGLLSIW